jgi:teichoic acid transport system permease protein
LKINPVTYLVQGYRESMFFHEWITARPMQTIVFLIELSIMLILALVIGRNTRKELADVL